ncbi:hypothetical protein KP509_04G103300 [Ceratopteris richardii]|uniref:Rhodanese domain-containing protein n=1 Tax=Ceratopteris richardii TaxID=49495 RepID=A0A8T2V3K7_CERRI|nr:hypothetical protein KP509_04G103300 [Ceratopteris richardii]
MELCSRSSLCGRPQSSLFWQKENFSSPSSSVKLPPVDIRSRRLPSSSALLSSAVAWLTAGSTSAASYDDILGPGQLIEAPTDLDVSSIVDSVSGFAAENPVAVIAGLAAISIPLVISNFFGGPKTWGSISAKDALTKLEAEEAQFLDIRSSDDVKAEGTPDLRSVKKRVFQIPYVPGEDEAYIKKLLDKFKDPSNTTLYVLDQFDGNSLSVAELLTANGFMSAYAIKGGAEGSNGWRNSELPWILPRKGFTLDINSLKDVIDSTFNDNPNLVPATLGVAAAAGVSFVVFSEAETALQLLGSAALIQLFVKKFLFAKDRQKTLEELQTFLDTKIAPKEFVDEIKGISGALLPKYKDVGSGDTTNGAAVSTESIPVIEAESDATLTSGVADVKEQTNPVEPAKTVSEAAPEPLVAAADLPESSTPLSPYAQFPDLKPPAPPMPSRS